jgi:hypothetical protein
MLSCLTGWCTPLGLGWHSSIPRFASFAYWLTVCFHAIDATTTGTRECSHFQICILFQIWDVFLTRARNGCMLKANQWWTLSLDVCRKFTRMHIVLSPMWINFAYSLSVHIAISVWISKILFDVTECWSFPEKHTTYSQVFTPHDWLLLALCPIWPEPLLVIPLKSPFSVCYSLYQTVCKCSITIRLYSRDSSSAQITSLLFFLCCVESGING